MPFGSRRENVCVIFVWRVILLCFHLDRCVYLGNGKFSIKSYSSGRAHIKSFMSIAFTPASTLPCQRESDYCLQFVCNEKLLFAYVLHVFALVWVFFFVTIPSVFLPFFYLSFVRSLWSHTACSSPSALSLHAARIIIGSPYTHTCVSIPK